MYDTMVVVDDGEMNRTILKTLFQDSFTILEAENGQEAIEILDECQDHVNIILLDLVMPGISGIDVLKHCKKKTYLHNVSVVIITSSESVDDQIEAFKLGACDYITKPFTPEIVMSRVNNVLVSHRRVRSLMEEKKVLKYQAELDLMTGLYNKATTEAMVSEVLKTRFKNLHAMMVIDIDNFKAINDNEGHLAGDQTLKTISDLIVNQFRQSDIVGRVGGDEYVVLMTDLPSKEIARKKASEIATILKYKSNITLPTDVSVSIGLAFNNYKLIEYRDLFKMADEALYDAKNNGKAKYYEYGVTYEIERFDECDVIALLSCDRYVCSTFSSLLGEDNHFIEVSCIEELFDCLKKVNNIKLLYVDISSEKDAGVKLWKRLAMIGELRKTVCIAICKEGNMMQYRVALNNNISDIITVPLDRDFLRRRTIHNLETIGNRYGSK